MRRWAAAIALAGSLAVAPGGSSAIADGGQYVVVDLGPGSAQGINELGHVVGANSAGAFFWSEEGGLVALEPLPGDWSTSAYDVNDIDVVAGKSRGAEITAVRWTSAGVESLGRLPGQDESVAEGLVDLNTRIVDDCGCRLRSAEAINDHGEIVGTMLVGDRMHAFLLRPV